MLIRDDLDRGLTYSDYERARQQFIDMAQACGIRPDGIGFFGETGCPGISDIDAIAVGEPNQLRLLREKVEALREIDRVFGYCFWHPPVYALENISVSLRTLHTLHGLQPLESGPLSSLESLQEEEWVLSVVWFTFLLRCLRERSPAPSLRWLLLLYRNLEHSLLFFHKHVAEKFLPSSVLRQRVMAPGSESSPLVVELFNQIVESAIAAFDKACAVPVPVPESHQARTAVAYGLRGRLRLAAKTELDAKNSHTIWVNRTALDVALVHVLPGLASTRFEKFIADSGRVAGVYQRAGLPYPFVTPFGIPISGWRRHSSALTTRFLRY